VEVILSANVSGDVVGSYGSTIINNTSNRSSGTTDIVQVAIVNDTIKVATQAMDTQFSNFLNVFG
jgi:hypothetical protein